KALATDLKPLGAVPEERQRGDASLREYLRERFVARLAEPTAAELARVAGTGPLPRRALHAVRAVLLGAVASHEAPAHLLDKPLARVLDACIEAFAASLVVEADQIALDLPSAAIEMRAAAVRDALARVAS